MASAPPPFAQWKNIFDAVQIQTFDPHIEKTFYANLYLTCLAPVLFNDVDGTYRGYDHQNHPAATSRTTPPFPSGTFTGRSGRC